MRVVNDPALGRLTYPDSMSDEEIYADIDNKYRGLMTPKPKTSMLGQVKETVKGLVPGLGGLAEQAATGVAGYYADLAKAYGIGPGSEPVVKGIQDISKQVAESPVGEFFAPAPGYETAPKIGRALGSIGGIAASRLLGRGMPLGVGSAAGAGEQIERAIEAGAAPDQRLTAALLGAGTGLTEALPIELAFSRAMKMMPGNITNYGLQIVRNAALTGGVEAAQEAGQNFLQNLIAQGIYKPDQELVEGIGEAAALGGSAGAIFQAALDLTIGRKARRAGMPREKEPVVAEEPTAPEGPTAEELAATRREEIRQTQLARGINILDEADLEAFGIPKGKKTENTYGKLLGKDLSDPDQLAQVEKVLGEYLSGSRQKFNDISTIERVLDKQIAGEPLNLFEELVARNYAGEDVDAYLMSRLDELKARAPAREVKKEEVPAAPKTAKDIAAEQAAIARREALDRERVQAQQEKEASATEKAQAKAIRDLKKAGVTPIVPPAQGEGFAEAQPDLFGDITAQGPEVTRGSGQEAEFMRKRAEFENDLRQLDVAAQASVAGVPQADAAVQVTAAKVADAINKIPFSLGELVDIRNRIVRQGTQVPGSEVLLDAVNRKIAEQAGQEPEDAEAARQMQLFPEQQTELPFAETAQGDLFGDTGIASTLPTTEEAAPQGLTKEGLQGIGIAANKIKEYEGKNLTDEGVAESLRMELTKRATNFRRDLEKAKKDYAALLGPQGVTAGSEKKAAELETRIKRLEDSLNAAQENLRLFPDLEQGQFAFDALQPVEPTIFPTPTQQEEEKRFRKIKADEAAQEAAVEQGVASELPSRLPTSRTVEDVQELIDRIRPLRGKINNEKASPAEQAQYDQDLATLFSTVRGPGRIQLKFEATDPASLALNRAFAKAEGFLKNLSRKERSRLAKKLSTMRRGEAKREVATEVLGKQARREAEQFPEEGARKEAREISKERKVEAEKAAEAKKAPPIKKTDETRAVFTAVMKLKPNKITDQQAVKDLRQDINDAFDDISQKVDLAPIARLYNIKVDDLKEAVIDERVRLSGVDIETKRVVEEEARLAEAKKQKAKEETEEEKLRTKTFDEVRRAKAQPLGDMIRTLGQSEGKDFMPALRNISRTGNVADNLQKKIDAAFGEGALKREAPTAEEFEEQGRAQKVLRREVKTNEWKPFDTTFNYAVFRSGDKFAMVIPARYNVDDMVGSFKVKYPESQVEVLAKGTLANVKYVAMTAKGITENYAPEYIVTPQAGAQQRLAEKKANDLYAKVYEFLGNSSPKDIKSGVAVKNAVDKFGIDATLRGLANLRAQKAQMREKAEGGFAMDDRILDEALAYFDKTYNSQVYFSTREMRAAEEPNVGFANEFLNKTGGGKTLGYSAVDLLQTVARHEKNTETGRLARVLLTQAQKFKLQDIMVLYNPADGAGSYFTVSFLDPGQQKMSVLSIGKEHLYTPDVAVHEVIHAMSVVQMNKVENPEYKRTGARWEEAADGLFYLHRAVEAYAGSKGDTKLLKEYGMTNAYEFVAEALSNESLKSKLKAISVKDIEAEFNKYDLTKKQKDSLGLFDRLVRGARNVYEMFTKLLRQALNLPDNSQTVFDAVVNQFGKLIQQTTPSAVMSPTGFRGTMTVNKAVTPKKYGRDPLPADVLRILDEIKNNPALNIPGFKGKADAQRAIKTGALPFLSINQIRDIYGSDPRLSELGDYYTATQKMAGYRNNLREKFGDVLNDFYKVIKDNKGLKDKLFEVINEGSRLEVDVLKSASDYKDAAMKADHARLQAIYNSFPQDVKNFYQKYRKNNEFMLDEIKQSMIKRATSYVSDPQAKAEIKAMVEKKIDSFKEKGPYAPLMFFGNNWVVAGKDAQAIPFSFETKTQADEFAAKMKQQGYEVKQFESVKELKSKSAPRAGFFKQLEGVLDRNRVSPKAKDEIYQMTLMYLPEESFMRQFQNRKGAPSYERDALRNYGELADRIVHQLPKASYMSEMDNALETMKNKVKQDPDDAAGRVVAEVEKHFDAAMNPVMSPWANALGNLGFGWYMGANPSAAIVQLLQTPGVTLPWLAPKYGLNPTMAELTRAGRDFFGGTVKGAQGFYSIKTNPNLTATEKKAIQALYDLNVIPPAATEVGDIETMTGLKATGPVERTAKKVNYALGYMFQNAERFNREVTALAAFRLEYNRSKNYDKAVQAANDAVVETQGDYSDLNAPRIFKHPAAKVLLMFKKFLQMMLYLYGRNLQIVMDRNKFSPEERKLAVNRLGGLLGTSAMMSGVIGTPFYWMVEAIMNAMFQDEEDPYYDFTTSLRESMPEFVTAGIPGALTGANIASRTGFRDMPLLGFIPGIGTGAGGNAYSEGLVRDTLKAATGPVGGIVLNTERGLNLIGEGQIGRGIETMLPSVAKNFMKAYRYNDEGVRTLRGDPIVGEVSTYDQALQAFGFSPLDVATAQEKRNAAMGIQTDAQTSRQNVYMRLNLAIATGDDEGYEKALELVDKHNRKYPGMEIKPSQILTSVRTFQKRSADMLGGAYLEKGLRPYLAPMLSAEE